jgi:hypothetical protein
MKAEKETNPFLPEHVAHTYSEAVFLKKVPFRIQAGSGGPLPFIAMRSTELQFFLMSKMLGLK